MYSFCKDGQLHAGAGNRSVVTRSAAVVTALCSEPGETTSRVLSPVLRLRPEKGKQDGQGAGAHSICQKAEICRGEMIVMAVYSYLRGRYREDLELRINRKRTCSDMLCSDYMPGEKK